MSLEPQQRVDPANNVLLRHCQPLSVSSRPSQAARSRVGLSARPATHTLLFQPSTWPTLVSAARDVEFAEERADLSNDMRPQPDRLAVLQLHQVVAIGQARPDIDHDGGNVR